MKLYRPNELPEREFSVTFINALAQYWHTTRSFQCIGNPKKQHLLLYLDGCSIRYTDKEGRCFTAAPGDVVYTPIGSEYRAFLSDFRDAQAHTVGINLFLADPDGEPFALSEGILVFDHGDVPSAPLLFGRALSIAERTPLERRILMLEILSAICRPFGKAIPAAIRPALHLLTEEHGRMPTVRELAEECHISDAYFRKLFKESMGTSPAAYRKRLALERACRYLTYGDVSVGEIAELLGYTTVSHFIKEFGDAYGMPPLRYRRASRAK